MKWFEGGIAEAVAASKAKKAIFVVFVEGKDDTSKEIAQALDSPQVSSQLESNKFVAIKLQSDSDNYTFFAQIYQLVPVPSIFFIGENGSPLEIVGNSLSATDLAKIIDAILLKANPQESLVANSANFIQAEQKANTVSGAQESNNQKNEIEPIPETSSQNATDTNESNNSALDSKSADLSTEEKMRRARELIELQNKKRQEEEERKEREREIERRKMGKDVLKLKQQQQDKELREAAEERRKEKAADAAARQKILKQIEQDKLERKRKFEMHKEDQNVIAAAQQKKAEEEAQARARAQAAIDTSKARIQFRLPTGNNISNTFESSAKLGTLRSYVAENAQLPFQQFTMSASFPRRDFGSADDNKTLLELDLVPSAVILILPHKSGKEGAPAASAAVVKSSDGAGFFSTFFWTLMSPVVGIYNYVMGFITGRPRSDGNSSDNTNRDSGISGEFSSSNYRPLNVRRFGGESKIRARGNIHTLHSADDDNDENNTWNGNSTQQM